MAREKEPTLREKYSLWLEYFKRSNGYLRLIKRFPTREQYEVEKSGRKLPLTHVIEYKPKEIKFPLPKEVVDDYSRPNNFKRIKKKGQIPIPGTLMASGDVKVIDESSLAWKTFQFFADAIYNPFPYWWEKNFPKGEKIVEEVTEEWYRDTGLKYLPDMVISIPRLGVLEELVSEFRKLISAGKRELKNPRTERFRLLLRLRKEVRTRRADESWLYPSLSFRFDEVKDYLKTYHKIASYKNREKGITLKEIFCKENPNLAIYLCLYDKPRKERKTADQIRREETKKDEIGKTKEDRLERVAQSSYRLFKLHWRKANKIIRNAAMGIFPGRY